MTTTLATATDALDAVALEQAEALALTQAMPLPAAWSALVKEFTARAKSRSPDANGETDRRHKAWRVRVRLYAPNQNEEPAADSDPDRAGHLPGLTVCQGLPGVADHLAQLANGFHGQACLGLDMETLTHRLKSLRPTLSRRGGNAVWRVPYTIEVNMNPAVTVGGYVKQEWLARVDLEKVT